MPQVPVGLAVPVCHLTSCTNFNPVKDTPPFIDTWNNIHTFLTFDDKVGNLASIAKNYDFVWGAGFDHVDVYRSANPHMLLSYYMTMQRDDGTFSETDLGSAPGRLAYWKQIHPDWVLYKCDRQTPAYEYGDPNVPFNFANSQVQQWQIETYVQPASQYYDAMAVDNVNMENLFGACGYYENGTWVQRYTGQGDDPQWQADVVNWVIHFQRAVHELPKPMLFFANLSIGAVTINAETTQQVLAHLDGVLDEGSFTDYGSHTLSGQAWLQLVQYIDAVQKQNKPFFIINQYQHPITNNDVEWAISSYLMCNQRLAYLDLAAAKGYGHAMNFPQLKVQIGNPTGEMYQSQYAYWRDFTGGEVVVNPGNTSVAITTSAASSYMDINGMPMSHTFTLPPLTAKILLNK